MYESRARENPGGDQTTSDLTQKKPILEDRVLAGASPSPQATTAEQDLEMLRQRVEELTRDRVRLEGQNRELRRRFDESSARAQRDEALILAQHREFQLLSETLHKVYASHSWRMGAPFRAVVNTIRRLLRLPDPSRPGVVNGKPLGAGVAKVALLYSGCPGDAKRYRCDHLAEQLEFLGISTEVALQGEIDLEDALDCFSIFILHRVAHDRHVDRFIRQARSKGAKVLFDTDDWVFDPEAVRFIDTSEMNKRDQALYSEGLERYRETISRCDGMLVSTPALKDLAVGLSKEVRTLPNVMSRQMIELATAALAGSSRRYDRDSFEGSVTLGYFSGTPTHRKDFAVAIDAVEWAMRTYPSVRLLTVGHIDVSDRFQKFGERFEHLPLMPWQRLADTMARVDVNLAPLEPENPFTASKSAIKFLEAGLVGVPTIASPQSDFRRVVEHGSNGFLAEKPEDWRDCLAALIESSQLAQQMGEAARETVLTKCTTFTQCQEALEFVRALGPEPQERPLTINWILRAPIAGTGGGYWTIFRLANFLGAAGHRVRVYVEPIAHLEGKSHAEIQEFTEANFGPLNVQLVVGHERFLPADATIATNWPTAYSAAQQKDSLFRFYFVQDFEPEFYSNDDPLYREAEQTYNLPLQQICIGRSLAGRLHRLTGRSVECIDFAVDTNVFRTQVPAAERTGPLKVLFFARPGIKRRGFELGVEALEALSKARPDVEIRFFGAEDNELRDVTFPFTNLGVLDHGSLAREMNEAHVLLCFSLSANVSWVPLQAMACGCAVVEANVAGVREMVEPDTCLLAEPVAHEVCDRLLQLVDDADLRCRLAENASRALAERSWESSLLQFEEILRNRCFARMPGETADRGADEVAPPAAMAAGGRG